MCELEQKFEKAMSIFSPGAILMGSKKGTTLGIKSEIQMEENEYSVYKRVSAWLS